MACSAQTARLALRLQEGQDVALADRALHVADQGAAAELRVGVRHEHHAHLDDAAARARAAQHLLDLNIVVCYIIM